MKTFVALLRGINVGGNSKVPMSDLKICFEEAGYSNVRTYINSGNVIFESKEKVDDVEIEKMLEEKFGFSIRVVVKSAEDIKRICEKIPADWSNDIEQRTDVIFLWEEVDKPDVLKEIEINPGVDNLTYVKGAVVWNFDKKDYTKSKMHKFIGTHIYKNMTARNVNTVRKLNSLIESV
jgi:uncharacterized protein (DUF1697 family)